MTKSVPPHRPTSRIKKRLRVTDQNRHSRAEPLANRRHHPGQQALDVLYVVQLRRPPVLLVDHDHLPVRLVCAQPRERMSSRQQASRAQRPERRRKERPNQTDGNKLAQTHHAARDDERQPAPRGRRAGSNTCMYLPRAARMSVCCACFLNQHRPTALTNRLTNEKDVAAVNLFGGRAKNATLFQNVGDLSKRVPQKQFD